MNRTGSPVLKVTHRFKRIQGIKVLKVDLWLVLNTLSAMTVNIRVDNNKVLKEES